ncbi:hypothetical protein Palpr_0926 [Paludibacter propionicigenes WB4]|uniref:Uncharacterized protein n=1 Tax=Paludibacter propionicigenes (strain DSM 17365 / JCM 13257 / WB4) TaxID=694427 RepID=E4T2Y2_PALPW|nr:hypothetical protein Palpr_0926 [Paludibacter propionicigenes WB4]
MIKKTPIDNKLSEFFILYKISKATNFEVIPLHSSKQLQ